MESFKLGSLKFLFKLERTQRSFKVSLEVGNFRSIFQILFQISNLKLSSFSFFLTALSNYMYTLIHHPSRNKTFEILSRDACDFELQIRTIQFLVKFLVENRSRVKILRKLTFFSSRLLKIRREIEIEAKMIRNLTRN